MGKGAHNRDLLSRLAEADLAAETAASTNVMVERYVMTPDELAAWRDREAERRGSDRRGEGRMAHGRRDQQALPHLNLDRRGRPRRWSTLRACEV